MIGVVVWSSEPREKAVIWCEDQASLAYLQGYSNLASSTDWPQPGDLVELECEMIGNLRHARHVTLLSEKGCPHLPEMLRNAAPAPEPHLRVVARQDRVTPRDADPHAFAAMRASAGR